MKKEKKMAISRRVDEVTKKGDELSRKLSLMVVEEATGEDSATVALYALARTVFIIVNAQINAGHTDAMERFITLLEGEIYAKILMLRRKTDIRK